MGYTEETSVPIGLRYSGEHDLKVSYLGDTLQYPFNLEKCYLHTLFNNLFL